MGHLGEHPVGLAVFPHPKNPAHPWFTRAYGIVLCNHHRFGGQTLRPGERLRLQWRVVAHDGDAAAAGAGRLYERYLAVCRSGLDEALAWQA